MAELLLELVSEEIPARMQARAAADLARLVGDGLKGAGLSFTSARAFATPRRLALVVDGLPAVRADTSEEKRGPRVGAPDQAIQGFLKGAGLSSLDQAEQRDTGKGIFWFAVIRKPGGPTALALPAILDAALAALPWPKSMKWGSGTRHWVRPLQSIVALFDGATLAGAFDPGGGMAPIPYGNVTRGHRFLAAGPIEVASFADYTAKLRAARVLLDPEERKRAIQEKAAALCAAAGVRLRADTGLLDEVAGLVDWPVALLGRIDPQFMDVPPEVLVTAMRTHQRYFATETADGQLADRFVVVANTEARDGGAAIVDGNERVLRARLADAKFFWDQDRKTTLEARLPALAEIVFHAKLGTVADRVARIATLAGELAAFVPGTDRATVERAARLAKADLVSGMVGEFPELQGTMGAYYARHEGLPEAVATAIADHYAPAGAADRCPTTPVSVALALADKLEILTSFWSVGEKPTGSRDPFALRRAALGVIRLVLENRLRLPLGRFAGTGDLLDFFAERLKVQARESGVRHDVVDSVFAAGADDDLVRVMARVGAVQAFLATEEGRNLLAGYTRAASIVAAECKKDKALATSLVGAADSGLFEAAEEKALGASLAETLGALDSVLQREDFVGAMRVLSGLRAPIDAFFDRVQVNVANRPELRLNRLKLLDQIGAVTRRVADFSKIEG